MPDDFSPLGGPRVRMTFQTSERRGLLRRWKSNPPSSHVYFNKRFALQVYADMQTWVDARPGERMISEPTITETSEPMRFDHHAYTVADA